jgi:hypothetical protein
MGSKTESDTKTITHKVQTGGEITVNLILTIKLEGDGLSVSAASAAPATSKRLMREQIVMPAEDDNVDWIIPNIESEGIIQFGKKVED